MRETLARITAALITGLIVFLAALFAERRNAGEAHTVARTPAGAASTPAAPVADPALVTRGRVVYEAQSCARCHSVEGRGNPRIPLDGVGARRTPAELGDWVTAEGPAAQGLSPSTRRTKEGFRSLSDPNREALVAYLVSLR